MLARAGVEGGGDPACGRKEMVVASGPPEERLVNQDEKNKQGGDIA